MNQRRKHERGVAIAYVALFLVVIFGVAAIGVDLGRLAHTATEVQTVADAAARAGAKALQRNGGTPNAGITGAKLVGGKNIMDGVLAPSTPTATAALLVDEGSYDTTDQQFKCCTSNSPCCSGGSWGDLTCVNSTSCTTRSAVLAIPSTTVTNVFASTIDHIVGGRFGAASSGPGNSVTKVEKLAVAFPGGPSTACEVPPGCQPNNWGCYCDAGVAPCLPIAASVCSFPDSCDGSNCTLPNLQVSNNTNDTACWTGFGASSDANTIRSYMYQGPCRPNGQGNTGTIIPPQTISGSSINLNNGINTNGQGNVFDLAACLAGVNPAPQNVPQGCEVDGNNKIIPGQRGNVFTIPIYDTGGVCPQPCNQSAPMVGFATVRITGVLTTSPRTVAIQTIPNTTPQPTPSGGGCFGTDCKITMAR